MPQVSIDYTRIIAISLLSSKAILQELLKEFREIVALVYYKEKQGNIQYNNSPSLTRGKEILRHSAATIYKVIRLIIGAQIKNSRLVAYSIIIGKCYLNRYYLRFGINIRIVYSYFLVGNSIVPIILRLLELEVRRFNAILIVQL